MKNKGTIYIKDFFVLSGVENYSYSPSGYFKTIINSKTVLFYQKSRLTTNYTLLNINRKFEIWLSNTFYPLFHYKTDRCEVITPNYLHLFYLHLPLSINKNSIREFILFNSTTQNHTFHVEVERLFDVDTLIIKNNEIKFKKNLKENEENYYLENIFQKRIGSIMPDIKEFKHGIFLSGGGESRINAALAQYYGLQKEFITWGHPEDKEYKIANKISSQLKTKHINIRPDPSNLPYKELLFKTGFLVNMKYAYRYAAVKHLFENYAYDIIWTGWGDINRYPTMYQPSELFTDFYLGLYKGAKRYPNGWNHDWLATYKLENNKLYNHITNSPTIETFFRIIQEELAPRIFGQVLSAENQIMPVFAPWFSSKIYYAVHQEEMNNTTLIKNKKARTIWKGDLYYRLLKDYCPSLNNIIHSKGYYPWMIQKKHGLVGLAIAAIMKKSMSHKHFPFDPVENKGFLKKELLNIVESNNTIFDKQEIREIASNCKKWNGPEILEIFKIIQISWLLK